MRLIRLILRIVGPIVGLHERYRDIAMKRICANAIALVAFTE